jgi:dienelactone hydrolase
MIGFMLSGMGRFDRTIEWLREQIANARETLTARENVDFVPETKFGDNNRNRVFEILLGADRAISRVAPKRFGKMKWTIAKWQLEFMRRLRRLTGKSEEKWPSVSADVFLNPSDADFAAYENAKLGLTWRRTARGNTPSWQMTARSKLCELLGIDSLRISMTAPSVIAGAQMATPNHRRQTLYLLMAPRRHVPTTIVWDPEYSGEPRPVMICLQGHTSGAHISWGEARLPIDATRIKNGGDFAIQALHHGHVAICIEQIGFGERREQAIKHRWEHPCIDACNRALLLGRTVLGDRVSDVMAVIDWLRSRPANLPTIDAARIRIMGNSAGGETALCAMALDARIEAAIASGCVGAWRKTSGTRLTCPDTVIPGVLNWFEYSDILAMCAPRPLLVLSGVNDHLYPYRLAADCVEEAHPAYSEIGASNRLQAVPGSSGHRFYPNVAWPAFLNLINLAAP